MGPYTAFILESMTPLAMHPLCQGGVGGGVLSAWWFGTFSMVDALQCELARHTEIFTFCAYSVRKAHDSFPVFLGREPLISFLLRL